MTSTPLATTDGSMAFNCRLGDGSPHPGMTSEAPWARQHLGSTTTNVMVQGNFANAGTCKIVETEVYKTSRWTQC
jgi:hypothetical protein